MIQTVRNREKAPMSSEEIVTIVDEHNRVIGSAPRRVMRAERLIHRATYILVFNSGGEIFVQERTTTKDIYPGYLDVAAGGVVQAGESYQTAALRELEEELGVRAEHLERQFDIFYQAPNNRVWGRVFSCIHEGPFRLQPEEVASGRFMDPRLVLTPDETRRFTPDGIEILARYLADRTASGACD